VLRFLAHFHNVLVYVLIIAAIVTASLDHWVDTWVILAVVIANAIIGFIQEGRAEESMAAIRQMLAPEASILRADARVRVDAVDLVPCDVVLLEAGELVLTDDSFASIVAAVREERTAYVNLRKVLAFELPTSFGEAGVILLALVLGSSLPISPLQVLWINLVTGVTLGLALAFEPSEEGTMSQPPRQNDASLVGGPLIWHIAFVTTLFMGAIFDLFFIRNIFGTSLTWAAARGTKAVWICIAVIVSAQLAVTYWPVAQGIFGTASIQFYYGALIIAIGAVFFCIIEVEKQLRSTLTGRHAM